MPPFNAHLSAASGGGGARYNEAILSRDRHREHRIAYHRKPTLDSFNAASEERARAPVARHRRADGGESRDADRQSARFAPARQSANHSLTTPAARLRGEGDHFRRRLTTPAVHRREAGVRARKRGGQVDATSQRERRGGNLIPRSRVSLTRRLHHHQGRAGGGCAQAHTNKDFIGKDPGFGAGRRDQPSGWVRNCFSVSGTRCIRS